MGYIGRKRKWKSGDRPSEPANPSGQSRPQPGPSGEPAALGDSQAETTSYKRSRPGPVNPLPRAATSPSSPQLGPSTEVAAHCDDGQTSSSTSSRLGAANTLPRVVDTPRYPQQGSFREHVALAGATSPMTSRPGAASPLPRAVDQPRSPQPLASYQVFEPREVPGAGPAHGDGYPPHAPPQALAPNHHDPVLDTAMASIPRSTADALAVFSTQVATLLVCSGNDVNTRELLENFLGETNRQLSQMISNIVTYYNGGLPLVLFDPDVMAKEARCPICLEEYQLGDEMSVLPCQHQLHSQCIRSWLERSRTCPVCRAGV